MEPVEEQGAVRIDKHSFEAEQPADPSAQRGNPHQQRESQEKRGGQQRIAVEQQRPQKRYSIARAEGKITQRSTQITKREHLRYAEKAAELRE